MKKKLILGLSAILVALAVAPLFAAFEAHVINVTATIENALEVHGLTHFDFGTMFPQEYREASFFDIRTSDSFSSETQTRVLNIDYQIKQKPKPRPEFVSQKGLDAARQWCHDNVNDPNFLTNCYPSLCPYLSKNPQHPEQGDVGVSAFHDPFATSSIAYGMLKKWSDLGDQWVIDLDVPCFKGQCAQDWTHQGFEPDPSLNGQKFGCDLWVEVTKIY